MVLSGKFFDSLLDLVGNTPDPSDVCVVVNSFYAEWQAKLSGASGGGQFVWVPTAQKALHDGALYVSPTVPWDGTNATVLAWQSKTGETQPTGTGCWRRVTDGLDVCSSWWGTIANDTSIDAAPALGKMWAYLKTRLTTVTSNITRVDVKAKIPAGKYLINSSVNWTGLWGWNLHVESAGAVFVAGSGCAGKAMFDATNVRGLHLKGLMVESTLAIENAPLCGLLVGNSGTLTCGNNKFDDLKVQGAFTYAAYVNVGSETTYYYNCYFSQTAGDVVGGVRRYSVVADGMHSDARVVSNYTVLRANGVAVSYTNNKFYGSHFRNYGGGSALFLRSNFDWGFDGGCYYLAFDKSNIVIYNDQTYRTSNVKIAGLFETSQGAGVKNVVEFVVPDGASCAISSFELSTMTPLASSSIFKVVNVAGNASTGFLKLTQTRIEVSTLKSTALMFEQCGNLRVYGYIGTRSSERLNIKDIAEFKGTLYVQDRSLLDITGISSKPMHFNIIDEMGIGYRIGSETHNGDLTVTGEISTVELEAAVFGSNGWYTVSSLTSGVADCSTRSLIQLNIGSGQTVTGLTDSSVVTAPIVVVRNISASAVIVRNNTSSLRLNGGVDKALQTNESITFVKVTTGIYQEIAGKSPHVLNSSTGAGYGLGSGGTVTQSTSKSTGLALNKPTGKITMNAAALAAGASVSFLVSNSTASATDALVLGFDGSGPTSQELNYRLAWSMSSAGGAFTIVLQNISSASLSEAVAIRFSLQKSSNS